MENVILQERFALRVREAMESERVSQSELARRMSVTPSMVSQYINGLRSPGLDVVERFSRALNIDDPTILLSSEKISLAIA